MTRAQRHVSRRRFLRGAGGVAIGLPFLLAKEGDTRAQGNEPPQRLVTLFFGNGLPKVLSEKGFDSPSLAALKPFEAKLTMIRGINVYATGLGNGHTMGSMGFACGMDSTRADTKGGPSLDWVAYKETGAATPLPTLSTGVYGADDSQERMRIVHSWRAVRQPNEPIQDTLLLFNQLFGGRTAGPGGDPAKQAKGRASVLDAVIQEYKTVMSDAGGYSPAIRTVIGEHLEHVREMERRVLAQAMAATTAGGTCPAPEAPPALDVLKEKRVANWDKAWPIMVDLYVLALRCDLVRFGNLMVISGGDRFPFTTPFGSVANVHSDVYHRWPGQNGAILIEAVKWQMAKIAELFAKLDDPSYKEGNGGTLFDNTTLVMGTELGEPASHKRDDMTFWVGGGKFKRGFHDLTKVSDVDLYNTVLRGMGIDAKFGDMRYFKGLLPILA